MNLCDDGQEIKRTLLQREIEQAIPLQFLDLKNLKCSCCVKAQKKNKLFFFKWKHGTFPNIPREKIFLYSFCF